MKKYIGLLLFGLMGCGSTTSILTADGKVVSRTFEGMDIKCAKVKEWDVSEVRQDKNKVGCWCTSGPVLNPYSGQYVTIFGHAPDSLCEEPQEE